MNFFKILVAFSLLSIFACNDKEDNTPPEIELNGSNPMYVNLDSTYNEPGATVIDDVDGDISDKVIISGNVDTSTEGTYYKKYNAVDKAGNVAEEKTREIKVLIF